MAHLRADEAVADLGRLGAVAAPVIAPSTENPRLEHRRRNLTLLRDVLNELGSPERAAPAVHVTGTNGKGSTSNLIAEILTAAGQGVGHTLASGRAALSGFALPAAAWEKVAKHNAEIRELTSSISGDIKACVSIHEETLVHLIYAMPEVHTSVRVVEVGSGGETDLSNVVQPVVSVLTNVTLDHTELFGESVEEIATEKAGIIKAGAPAVTAETNPAVVDLFRRRAEGVGTELHTLDRSRVLEAQTSLSGTRLRLDTEMWGELALWSPLIGLHQIDNIALAVRAVELLPETLRPEARHVVAGVSAAQWPGRFQVIGYAGRTVVLDGAHNPAGARALVDTLEAVRAPRPRVGLLACLGRKDTVSIVREVSRAVDLLVLSPMGRLTGESNWDPAEAAMHATCEYRVAGDFQQALREAIHYAGVGGTVIAAGSLYTAEDALGLLVGLSFR